MSEYYSIITDAGAALEAAAAAGGPPVALTQFAVGDGGGAVVIPNPSQVALVNEVYRGSLSSLTTGEQPNVLVAQGIIPMESGGYTIREVGIFTQDGTLYSVSNYPDQVKPEPDSGYAAKLGIEYLLQVSSTSDITLIVIPQDYLTEERANTLYVNVAGDTMTGTLSITQDGSAIIIQADSPGANNFIKSLDSDGSNNWFVGYGNAGENTLSLWNYKSGVGIELADRPIFNAPIAINNVVAGNPVYIGGGSPTIHLQDTDTGKSFFLLVDGTSVRLDEDNTATSVWAWNSDTFTVKGVVVADSKSMVALPNGWTGGGMTSEQLSDGNAPFLIEPFLAPGNIYLPIIKAIAETAGVGYRASADFGMLIDGGDKFPFPCITSVNDRGEVKQWAFDPNGVTGSQSVLFKSDGNILGSVFYAGNLRSHLDVLVNDVSLGANVWQPRTTGDDNSSDQQVPPGHTMIGLATSPFDSSDTVTGIYYKPIQKYVSGSWVIING